MNQPDQGSYPSAAATYTRLRAALRVVPFLDTDATPALNEWFLAMLTPLGLLSEKPLGFEVSLAAGLDRVACRVAGPAGDYVERLRTSLAPYPVAAEETLLLQDLMSLLAPLRVGSWIELEPESVDAGWYLPDAVPLAAALDAASPTPARDRLAAWAKAHGIVRCARLGRQLSEAWRYTELLLPLSEAHHAEALTAALELFRTLRLPTPGQTAIAALEEYHDGALALSIWLSDEGVVKLGIVASRPSTQLVLRLCRARGINQDKKLDLFEGLLGADHGPGCVEFAMFAGGFGVDLHYGMSFD